MKKSSLTIQEVLTKRVAEVLPSRKGLEALMRKKKIRLYFGVDPTGPQLHLGHAVALKKLRQFQDLGHEVVLVFGTFTAQIGDPSGKDTQREPLSLKDIQKNMAMYKKQASKILDFKKTKIKLNGDWLGKLKFDDLLKLSSQFTVAQLMERDMFQKRVEKGSEVWVSELLYPLMQGYDSVAIDVDLEVGGTDQTFNMLVGRRLQKIYNKKEKYVLATPLLIGLDGRKMSKSYGNTVNLLNDPQDMYGKLMSMKDDLIEHYVELCTDIPIKETQDLSRRDAKAKLAREIVAIYHGKKAAEAAEKEFNAVFRDKKAPEGIKTLSMGGKHSLVNVVVRVGFATSNSEARRLIEQGGVRIDGKVQKDPLQEIELQKGMIIQKGKKEFRKIA